MVRRPSGLEDVLTRVPLLVRTPGGARGHVVTTPVQLFDIVPTFLDIAGINATHVHFGLSQKDSILHGTDGDENRVRVCVRARVPTLRTFTC